MRGRSPIEVDRVPEPIALLGHGQEFFARPCDLSRVDAPRAVGHDPDRSGGVGLPREAVPVRRGVEHPAAGNTSDRDVRRTRHVVPERSENREKGTVSLGNSHEIGSPSLPPPSLSKHLPVWMRAAL